MIHLQTLGGLDLRRSGVESLAAVTSRPREIGLLVYLASAGPGAFRRRDTVLAMLWPESPQDRARHTLNQMLYRLRRILGDETLVSHGQDEVGTSADHLRCDVVEFRSALEDARWGDALALYHGPFLPGFFVSGAPELERWIDEERQAHRRGARDAAVALSEQRERAGDLREAAEWARKAWEIEPASDSLLRRPLDLLHRLGERSEALVLFEGFRQRIAEEYGLEPSPETLEMVARIRGAGREGPPSGASHTAAATPDLRDTREVGHSPPASVSRASRGLGGTLAGAGAALVGAAAVAWVFLSSGPVTPRAAPLEGTAPVVVVLPVALSGSVSADYGDLARALTTELTARLEEIPDLLVVPPEMVERHLDETVDPVELGRRLQGNAVVESRLHWQAAGVETSARVVDVGSGETLWDVRHSYPHSEILNAQLDLTVGLASALNVRLSSLPTRDLTFSSDEELRAWSLVSRALDTLAGAGGPLSAEREAAARRLIDGALAIQPAYAPAYAALSRVYSTIWDWDRSEVDRLDSAVIAAERAVALDPDHYQAQLALSRALGFAAIASPERYPPTTDRRRAEAALRAVQLHPSSPEGAGSMAASFSYAGMVGRSLLWNERARSLRRDWQGVQNNRAHRFWLLGDYDSAIEAQHMASELDPRRPRPGAFRVPEYNLSRGRLGEARRQIEAVRAADPGNVMTYPVLVYLELMEENYQAAEELVEELLNREPPVEVINTSNFLTRTVLGFVYLKTGRTREGRRLLEMVLDNHLDRIGVGSGYTGHYDTARIYAMLGEPENAIDRLRIAIDRGWPFYYTEMGLTDPMLENLREREDFQRIMGDLKAKLDAEREWVHEMLALPEPERFNAMLIDAERQLEVLWDAQRVSR